MRNLRRNILILCLSGAVAACGGGSGNPEGPGGGGAPETPIPSPTVTPSPSGIQVSAPAPITVAAVDALGTPASDDLIQTFLMSATARDANQQPIADIQHDAPDTFPLGATRVTFSVQANNGDIVDASSTITVTDMTAPTVRLLGDEIVTLPLGVEYQEAGAAAQDNVDGDLSTEVTIEGSVDSTTAGVYTLRYGVSDEAGNIATFVHREVRVENAAPPSPAMTIYVEKPENWSTVHIYYWDVEPEGALADADWPGVEMEAVGGQWYRYRLENADASNVIFSDNAANQTDDLNRAGTGCYTIASASWSDECDLPSGINASPGSQTFSSSNLEITLQISGTDITQAFYSLDGSDPQNDGIAFNDDERITIGDGLGIGDSITLRLFAQTGADTFEELYTYTKQAPPEAGDFSWDNAAVYFVLTDRFLDADSRNNNSYGRERSPSGEIYTGYEHREGTFHGGDLQGLTQKIEEGYFNDLGVNAIWITSPLEQVHGYVGGENFKHYAYHGYYHLDFTELDANMGTEQDFKNFVDTAHANGIRVVMDIVMNHAGYETLGDMDEFNFGSLADGWSDYYFTPDDTQIHFDTYGGFVLSGSNTGSAWGNWWGGDWIRKSNGEGAYPGYTPCGNSETSMCLSGLPDFRTESNAPVDLPPLLINKWGAVKTDIEQAELNTFFRDTGLQPTVANHLIKWLSDWVREYGIDGFRVDTAKHVELAVWQELKDQASAAYEEWKAANPNALPDDQDLPFWMTGEVWNHGVGRSQYFDNGFDSVINFRFKEQAGNLDTIDGVFSEYASKINSDPSFNVLSYISSHDTALFDRNNMINAGTSLLLLPGAVQIFYGDESNRLGDDDFHWDQPTRSDMNWGAMDQANLDHWQKLGQFRARHIAIGAGSHRKISESPYTFARELGDDTVVVALNVNGDVTLDVGGVFSDGETLVDAYNGATLTVENGSVQLRNIQSPGVVLLERSN